MTLHHMELNRTQFMPRVTRGEDGVIIACHETGRCSAPGRYCKELPCCELLDVRCSMLEDCDGCCSVCPKAVAG